MSDLLQIFQTNPLSTFIGRKIEAATRPELESEDWALNMEICDLINENEEDAKDAAKAIKKRLQQSEQDGNFVFMNRALTLLDTCVNNCSHRFHVLVMTKDFISGLVKLIGPKNCPPIPLQERVLGLIERWADAFRLQSDLGGVVAVYNDLKSKGVTFPERDPTSSVPIQTPMRSVHSPTPQTNQLPDVHVRDRGITTPIPMMPGAMMVAPSHHQTTPLMLTGPGPNSMNQLPPQAQLPPTPTILEGSAYSQASEEVQTINNAVTMFNDVIGNLESSTDESDWSLADTLNGTCQQMKRRVMDLVSLVLNEDLMASLIKLNDDLMQVFAKYEQLILNKSTQESCRISSVGGDESGQSTRINELETTKQSQVTNNEPEVSLIDLDLSSEPKDTPVLPIPLQPIEPEPSSSGNISLSHRHNDEQQTRPKTPLEGATKSIPKEVSSLREQDLAEIEKWLATDTGAKTGPENSSGSEPFSIPSSEFDNFIANRASAGAPGAGNSVTQSENQARPSEASGGLNGAK